VQNLVAKYLLDFSAKVDILERAVNLLINAAFEALVLPQDVLQIVLSNIESLAEPSDNPSASFVSLPAAAADHVKKIVIQSPLLGEVLLELVALRYKDLLNDKGYLLNYFKKYFPKVSELMADSNSSHNVHATFVNELRSILGRIHEGKFSNVVEEINMIFTILLLIHNESPDNLAVISKSQKEINEITKQISVNSAPSPSVTFSLTNAIGQLIQLLNTSAN